MSNDAIYIDKIDTETLLIPIVGTAPLIVHNFGEKSKRQMLEAQQGRKKAKELRDPEGEYLSSLYRLVDEGGVETYGFPVTAFKAATVGAARFYGKQLKMTELRQFMFFRGVLTPGDPQQLVPLEGEPRMREDVVRLAGMGRPADLRYRAEFPVWGAVLEVTYVRTSLARESVLSLVNAGGLGVGVGEWRPEKRGEFGTFEVDPGREIQVIA